MRAQEINGWEDLGANFFSLSSSGWALVPLEAWRRGLKVTLRPNAHYTLSDEFATYEFWQTRLTGTSGDQIAQDCDDKQVTREILHAAGVPAPAGRLFSGELDKAEILVQAAELGFPVCLKPNDWAKGRGVYPKLKDAESFSAALDALVDDMGCTNVVVEQHIPGKALRVFVAGDTAISATWAEAANVVGDGASTVAELITEKAVARKSNPHLRNSPMVLDAAVEEHLAENGLTPQSVPADGHTVQLRAAANLALGGDSWDITETLSPKIAQVAVNAVRAIPGLRHAAVDLLADDPYSEDAAVFVNELNPSAGLGGHMYPARGVRHDVAEAIVDQYFPNTRRLPGSKHWYFSLNQSIRLFTARVADEVSLAPMPELRSPRWQTLRLIGDASRVATLRTAFVSEFSRSKVHGRVSRATSGQFDIHLVGEKAAVAAADRTVRERAQRSGVTVKPVSSMPFRVAAGFLS